MSDDTYNGWSNYETWVVKLWMDNDQSSYTNWQETTDSFWRDAVYACQNHHPNPDAGDEKDPQRVATYELSVCLKGYHERMRAEAMPQQAGVFSDLLGAALSSVNWYEIAKSLVEEHCEENVA